MEHLVTWCQVNASVHLVTMELAVTEVTLITDLTYIHFFPLGLMEFSIFYCVTLLLAVLHSV